MCELTYLLSFGMAAGPAMPAPLRATALARRGQTEGQVVCTLETEREPLLLEGREERLFQFQECKVPDQIRTDPLTPTQKPWSPRTVHLCAKRPGGHKPTLDIPAGYGYPVRRYCQSCYHLEPLEPADSGELIPGYESEAWNEPAHAWKTPITFRGTILTVYTGATSGSTPEKVRDYLQHEYRAARIGMPEVAR